MVKIYQTCVLLTISCLLVCACKLDEAPLSPSGNIKEDDTVLGMTIAGTELNNPYLTAQWKVTHTVLEYYDTTNVVVEGGINSNFYTGLIMNDNSKKINFINLAPGATAPGGVYKLNTTTNVFYIKLPIDPFSRAANTPIRITKLNSTSMTWVAIDSPLITYNGKLVRKAYKVLYYR